MYIHKLYIRHLTRKVGLDSSAVSRCENSKEYNRTYACVVHFHLLLLTESCRRHQNANPELMYGHFNENVTCCPHERGKIVLWRKQTLHYKTSCLGLVPASCRLQNYRTSGGLMGACRFIQSLVEGWQYFSGNKYRIFFYQYGLTRVESNLRINNFTRVYIH